MDQIANVLNGRLDWDGRGEDWATIMIGDQAAAHIYMLAPLILSRVEHEGAIRAAAGPSVSIVGATDMDADELRVDPDALMAAFDFHVPAHDFDPDAFSANDLWFWTI